MKNIILCGFMTSGKTTVGRLLAARLKRPFIDLDRTIERHMGHRIPTLFALLGVKKFRKLETKMLRQVCRRSGQVIALGGGALLNPANRALVSRKGTLLLLEVHPATVMKRLSPAQKASRPLLAGLSDAAIRKKIILLMRQRRVGFSHAIHRIRTDARSPKFLADKIVRLLSS
ncbi:MAG TPA: shikimate kinase [Bdellovibrionales bacterium]|nr:MAG: hypothetical protein A2Z97_07585 [Bdellovibrionales bacterium GWB1_52_6]OFZ04742.1 MAG: hypothetical protein A2X97_13530 [Bdellovibrionales bacterium GWA1_52_35]OFZ35657.1 MAG: hypothetical protein A2070_01150 [Bdellovibrionales bacterium GWC1_52_8]HAR42025.1 shikimate kinase [Bdellovibrionales bacterium]HCM39555.1 shikimate kinase [Bdellovibrionales bacterium]